MPVVDILPSVAPAIAKSLYNTITQERRLSELVGEFQQGITERGLDYIRLRRIGRPVEPLADRIAARLVGMFDAETGSLDHRARLSVLLALYESLCRDDIDDPLLGEVGRDAAKLERYLVERAGAPRGVAEHELTFYHRLLREACRAIIRISSEIHYFDGCPEVESPEGQERILTMLADEPDYADPESEKILANYLREMIDLLDNPVPVGIFGADRGNREQGLYRSFVPPELARAGGRTPDADERIDLDALLTDNWRIVITGEAGSGKSALLRWLGIRSACREFPRGLERWNRTVPVYLRLRELAETGLPDVDTLARSISPSLDALLPEGWLRRQLEHGRGLILIDGIDELPRARRIPFIERLERLIERYPFSRYILASRPTAVSADLWPEWEKWVTRERFSTATIAPLSDRSVETVIDRWHGAEAAVAGSPGERREIRARAVSLVELLHTDPRLDRLARNPLHALLLCTLAREGSEPRPAIRTVLFDMACTAFLDRRPAERPVPTTEVKLNEQQKRRLLEGFASWMVKNGLTEATAAQADKRFGDLLKTMSLPRSVSGTSIRMAIIDDEELLRENAQGDIEFVHRSFQEYLAAASMANAEGILLLLEHASDDMWWNTIIFAAGLLESKDREALIAGIVDKARPPRRFFRRPEPAEYDRPLMQLSLACIRSSGDVAADLKETITTVTGALFKTPQREATPMV